MAPTGWCSGCVRKFRDTHNRELAKRWFSRRVADGLKWRDVYLTFSGSRSLNLRIFSSALLAGSFIRGGVEDEVMEVAAVVAILQ